MNIGILGGTFDPIHNGHIRLAELAYEQFDLDEVWVMPAPVPPFKPSTCAASYEDRLNMVRLAVRDKDGLVCSDYEFHANHGDRSYTSDTISALKQERPGDRLFLIMGADSLYTIDTWYKPDIIFRCATLIAAVRKYDKEDVTLEQARERLKTRYDACIEFIDSEEYDVSSTEIKRRLAAGETVAEFLPRDVERYIREQGLYKTA